MIDALLERGVLAPIDAHFARTMGRIAGEARPEVLLGAALASRAVQRGHVCADLRRLSQAPLLDDDGAPVEVELPALAGWLERLVESPLVSDGSRPTPLVLDAGARLYLHRYHDYQQRLAESLRARARVFGEIDRDLLRVGLARLFPPRADRAPDHQRLAAAVALTHRFAVISGGPGTGKTTTVAKILALLHEQALAQGAARFRVALFAPTGKAAGRLAESIAARAVELACAPEVKRAVALHAQASTIHRGLGFDAAAPTRFRHDASRPLSADAVIVDEASMIDLALMTKLVEAVRPDARLVLLGDKDQLASVEAGAILGDLYNAELERSYTPGFAALLAELGVEVPAAAAPPHPLQDCMVHLDRSYRYGAASGIAALARAVNAGDAAEASSVLRGERTMPYGEVALAAIDAKRPLDGLFGRTVVEGFSEWLGSDDPFERLERLGRFRVLCVHRRGPLGAETMNRLIESHLARAGALTVDGAFYDGRPILVTRNDHQLGLFNGDVGVVIRRRDGGTSVAFFPEPSAAAGPRSVRLVHPARLPPHETVFAMTVHKSQGSEFSRVALLLPTQPSPIVTRELVYTAVSRARERVDIHGSAQVLAAAVARRIDRASGLREALWSR